jgi:HemY protein
VRGLIWVIFLATLAVAVTLGARYQAGYVLLTLHPYQIELSLNLFLVILLLAFVAGYFFVRIVARTLHLPSEVRQYRERRRIARTYRMLAETLRAYFEGRYARAEKSAGSLLDAQEFSGLAAVLAARAAHELRAYDRRDRYLARTAHYNENDQVMRAITQAELALQERDPQRALAALDPLSRKHTAALRLELRAMQQTRNWDRCLELLSQLARARALETNQIAELRHHAIAQNLARKARDAAELKAYWQRLDAIDRRDPAVAAAAARAFVQAGGCEEAHAVIEAALEVNWDSGLVALYADCPSPGVVKQIERAEKWLSAHPSDAGLLLTLGRLCMQRQLWGKARSYFEASLSLEESYLGRMRFGQLLEQLGETDAARENYRKSLELAVATLESTDAERPLALPPEPRRDPRPGVAA